MRWLLLIFIWTPWAYGAGSFDAYFERAKESNQAQGLFTISGTGPDAGLYDLIFFLDARTHRAVARDLNEADQRGTHSHTAFAWNFATGLRLGLGVGNLSSSLDQLSASERALEMGYRREHLKISLRGGQNEVVQNQTNKVTGTAIEYRQNWLELTAELIPNDWLSARAGLIGYAYEKLEEILAAVEYPFNRGRSGNPFSNNLAIPAKHAALLSLTLIAPNAEFELRAATAQEAFDDSRYTDVYLGLIYFVRPQVGVQVGSGNSFYPWAASVNYSHLGLRVTF